jgi:hypothetical protein
MYQLRTYTLKDRGSLDSQRGLSATLCDARHLDSPRRSRPHFLRPLLLPRTGRSRPVLAELVKSGDFKADVVDWDDSNILDYTDTFMTPSTASPLR